MWFQFLKQSQPSLLHTTLFHAFPIALTRITIIAPSWLLRHGRAKIESFILNELTRLCYNDVTQLPKVQQTTSQSSIHPYREKKFSLAGFLFLVIHSASQWWLEETSCQFNFVASLELFGLNSSMIASVMTSAVSDRSIVKLKIAENPGAVLIITVDWQLILGWGVGGRLTTINIWWVFLWPENHWRGDSHRILQSIPNYNNNRQVTIPPLFS